MVLKLIVRVEGSLLVGDGARKAQYLVFHQIVLDLAEDLTGWIKREPCSVQRANMSLKRLKP